MRLKGNENLVLLAGHNKNEKKLNETRKKCWK